MSTVRKLTEAGDEVVGRDDIVGIGGIHRVTDIVDALEDNEVLHSSLGEDVAIEAGQSVGAGVVVEDAVAADTLVQNAEVTRLLLCLKAASEHVGPAQVGVARAARAVGNAVAERDD